LASNLAPTSEYHCINLSLILFNIQINQINDLKIHGKLVCYAADNVLFVEGNSWGMGFSYIYVTGKSRNQANLRTAQTKRELPTILGENVTFWLLPGLIVGWLKNSTREATSFAKLKEC